MLQIVWFKRDLRLEDHAALTAAAARGPVIGLIAFERSLWSQPDSSGRHAGFFADCLEGLRQHAAGVGLPLLVIQCEMPQALDRLVHELGPFCLHSHQETGNAASYERDKRVLAWSRTRGIAWFEHAQNNVVRRLKSRDDWSRLGDARLSAPVHERPAFVALPPDLLARLAVLAASWDIADASPWRTLEATDRCPGRQAGGRERGLALLATFLEGRAAHYRGHMSSPGTAEESCSRLSPHLTWGSLSVREVMHAVWRARARWQADAQGHPDQRAMLASLKSFESRLHWHCHFIQKLESEPEIEWRCLHPATRGLRNEGDWSEQEANRFAAWKSGLTGFPFVDACMRFLHHNGWINFRMRAMLISFASQHLWLHWRGPGEHLARLFTDYEPGIHWPQIQMQSGTTGINTIRIYNPVKQAADQDPSGEFVARWAPQAHTSAYPPPVVDHLAAARMARERLWSLRRNDEAKDAAHSIFVKHGSRNPSRETGPRRSAALREKAPGRGHRNAPPMDTVLQRSLDLSLPADDEARADDTHQPGLCTPSGVSR